YVPGADVGSSLQVSLSGSGTIFMRQTVPVSRISNSTLFIGVLSGQPATLAQLKGFGGSLAGIQLVATPLDERTLDPQWLALANLDAIVVSNFDTSMLSGEQLRALQTWVTSGGTLITVGGPTAQGTVGGLPAPLRLVAHGRPTILGRVPSLERMAGTLPPGQVIADTGTVDESHIVLDNESLHLAGDRTSANAIPLIIQRFVGSGSVVYSTIDPTLQPLASWRGLQAYWATLARMVRAGAGTVVTGFAGTQPSSNASTINSEISSVSPPSLTIFIVLLAIYVFGLVPLNFLVLSRFRRRSLSWLSLPALAVVLLGAVFLAAYFGRGRDLQTSVVSVIFLSSDAKTAVGESYVGLVSPTSGNYSIAPANGSVLGAPLFYNQQNGAPADIGNLTGRLNLQQDTGQVTLPNLSSWSSRSASLSGVFPVQAGLTSNLSVSRAGNIVGKVTNTSNETIYGTLLVAFGGVPQPVGDLPPGASREISIATGQTSSNQNSIGSVYGNTGWLPRYTVNAMSGTQSTGRLEALLRAPLPTLLSAALPALQGTGVIQTNPGESQSERFQRIVSVALGSNEAAAFNSVIAVGWKSIAVMPFTVNGVQPARRDTDMIVQPLPIQLSTGTFVINPGTIPARLAGSDQDLQTRVGEGGITISPNSSAVFVATLPPPRPGAGTMHVKSLTVSAFSMGAGGALSDQTASLWDWSAERWEAVDITSGQVDIRQPGRFVDVGGVVRIRMSAQSASLEISDPNAGVSLGLTGEVR
ncbi:MAG: hypothetical protein JWO59_1539, partial [Chloroflexi bacterium]|nr:hypothetical protein [Chloroflexota bacterium]